MQSEPNVENCVSLRLKYGPQTLFLYADWSGTIDDLTKQLLTVLRERYPDGLHDYAMRPEVVKVPKEDESNFRIAYATPRNPRVMDGNWTLLADHTLKLSQVSPRLRDNSILAFLIVRDGEPEPDASSFHVETPSYSDDEE